MADIPDEGILSDTRIFSWTMKLSKLLDMPRDTFLYSSRFLRDQCEMYLSAVWDDDEDGKKRIGAHLYLHRIKSERWQNQLQRLPVTFQLRMDITRSELCILSSNEDAKCGEIRNSGSRFGFGDDGHGDSHILSFEPTTAKPDDVLVVTCKILPMEWNGTSFISWNQMESSFSSLSSDIKVLLYDSLLTDLSIQVGTKFIKAHKSILAARSPVFRSMFESGMVEAADSKLIIEDFSAVVVQLMLEFMYSGDESLIEKNGVPLEELLQIAEKYAFDQLKEVCETALTKSLTVDNAIEMLIFADMQNAYELKKEILQYIVQNSLSVLKTKAYLEMSSVDIIKEICSSLSSHNMENMVRLAFDRSSPTYDSD